MLRWESRGRTGWWVFRIDWLKPFFQVTSAFTKLYPFRRQAIQWKLQWANSIGKLPALAKAAFTPSMTVASDKPEAGVLKSLITKRSMAFTEKQRRLLDQWSGVAVVHVQATAPLWLKTTAVVFVRLFNTPCHL
jgi:hypothetical protein